MKRVLYKKIYIFHGKGIPQDFLQSLWLVVVKGNVTLFQGTSKFSNLHKRDRKMLLLPSIAAAAAAATISAIS